MSLFYNPKTKKVQTWIYPIFVLVPAVCIVFVLVLSKGAIKKSKQAETMENQVDIFDRIEKQ